MKRILFFCILLISISVYAQKEKTTEVLDSLKKLYIVDDNGNITFQRIIQLDSMKKDDVYTKSLEYITYSYNSANDVIQQKDKDDGIVIVRGLFANTLVKDKIFAIWTFDTWHIIKIETKDYKAIVTISLTDYNIAGYSSKIPISTCYPITSKNKRGYTDIYTELFINSCKKAISTIDNIEYELKNSNKGIKKSDW